MDKGDFMHFVNSVRWHCTISMRTTRFNEDIDRAVRGASFYYSHTLKRRNTTTIVAVKTTTTKRQQIETVIGICQEPLPVLKIVPLQSLQRGTRERGRVLGRRVQPSGKK